MLLWDNQLFYRKLRYYLRRLLALALLYRSLVWSRDFVCHIFRISKSVLEKEKKNLLRATTSKPLQPYLLGNLTNSMGSLMIFYTTGTIMTDLDYAFFLVCVVVSCIDYCYFSSCNWCYSFISFCCYCKISLCNW